MTYKVQVSTYMQYKCKEFTKLRTKDSEVYKKRGGYKELDILCGALGEMAVYTLLRTQDIPVNKPDLTIHEATDKSFKADLFDGTNHYHVKSQTIESVKKYGTSWLLQRTDPLLNKDLENHYLVLTVVDYKSGEVDIYGVIDINLILQKKLLGECKLEWFAKTKVAIYWSDIVDNLTELEMWSIL